MYKKNIVLVIYIVILINLFLPFVLSQEQADTQRIADVIAKVMQTSTKDIVEDINRNNDENFMQLDQRIMDNNNVQFRKAIFALTGSLGVIIFGYAYINNRVSRRYDITFFEKMIDSKLDKLSRLNYVMSSPSSYYTSVVNPQFEKRYTSPEGYFDGMSEQEQIKILKSQINDMKKKLSNSKSSAVKNHFYSSVSKNIPRSNKPMFKDKKKLKLISRILLFLIIVVVIVMLYVIFRHTGSVSSYIMSLFTNSSRGVP